MAMKKQGFRLTKIVEVIGRSVSTISRELKCNTGLKGYRYQQAHQLAQQRHKLKPKRVNMDDEMKAMILHYL